MGVLWSLLWGSDEKVQRNHNNTEEETQVVPNEDIIVDIIPEKITLYHYTTEEGLQGIIKDCVIRQSKSTGGKDDARFGDGVYLTSLKPTDGKIRLALNNWDGGVGYANKIIQWGGVSRYVVVDLDLDTVQRVESERDIYLYPGDLHITQDINPRTGIVTKK